MGIHSCLVPLTVERLRAAMAKPPYAKIATVLTLDGVAINYLK
jgi:hypothetical protein